MKIFTTNIDFTIKHECEKCLYDAYRKLLIVGNKELISNSRKLIEQMTMKNNYQITINQNSISYKLSNLSLITLSYKLDYKTNLDADCLIITRENTIDNEFFQNVRIENVIIG